MNDHNSFFTATGIPSLFLIFSVLCLAVLSLLTLGNSRSELSTARNSMQQTEDYYNACSQASTVISEIQTELTACLPAGHRSEELSCPCRTILQGSF